MNGTYRGLEGNIVPFVAAAAAGSRTFNQMSLSTIFGLMLSYCSVPIS